MSIRTPLALALALSIAASARAEEPPMPFTRLFDTGAHAPQALSDRAVAARKGWRQIGEDNVGHQFAGDAALANDRLVVVLRTEGRGVEVYANAADGPRLRATLAHAGGPWRALEGPREVKIIENAPGGVLVEATFGPPAFAALRLRLTAAEPILEIQPGRHASKLNMVTRARCVVVPDFFADDLIYGAEPFADLGLPTENLLLSPIEGGDAIVMAVWQSARQSASATTLACGRDTHLCAIAIGCIEGKSIWLAFLEGNRIWHDAAPPDPADWKPPFPARWRCTLGTRAGLAKSWDLEEGLPDGRLFGRHDGPGVVYPIDRTRETPLTLYCPTDVLRNTLGVGPCQYILAAEGLASVTNPTPDEVMTWVEKQFKRRKARASADAIRERLDEMTDHLRRVRARVLEYGEFASEVRRLCRERGRPRPLPAFAQELPLAADAMEKLVARSLEEAGPPDRPAQLASEVVALAGKQDALTRCERLGAELRAFGAAQDRALATCRTRTRWLNQCCAMVAAEEPQTADLVRSIQRRIEQILHPTKDKR